MSDFLGIERLNYGPWQAFERCIHRMLVHAGFKNVRLVGGTGDGGGDIVGEFGGKLWVVQAKFRSQGQLIGPSVIDEVTVAVDHYRADVAVVAASTGFTSEVPNIARKRKSDMGIPIFLWNGNNLLARDRSLPLYSEERDEPRPYQEAAIESVNQRIMQGASRGLVLMATGLGKTRVAASIVEKWLLDRPNSEVLVLVPTLPLVTQFEASLWPYLPKSVPTHIMTGSEKPAFTGGVTIATYQSASRRPDYSDRFGLVIVDEAHHAPADGFASLLEDLRPQYLLGMTATPWRGDERQLEDIFGNPTYSVSIVEGMQLGYLAQVDYRMLVDDINWEWVNSSLAGEVSLRDLNRQLFVPELDEAVVFKIRTHLDEMVKPRCVVFCRSIQHAERVARQLHAEGWPTRVLHSQLDRFEATKALRDFRSGTVPVIVAVDILNEGIDVPDVNMIVFLRVTHSRRIFVQQLGRGLRLSAGKTTVRVLDFVSDIRRLAAGLGLNREASDVAGRGTGEDAVIYPTGQIVQFEGDERLNFFMRYLEDVAELEDTDESARLKFPDAQVFSGG